jgi:hypothetical protein
MPSLCTIFIKSTLFIFSCIISINIHAEGNIFRDKNGEGIDPASMAICNFSTPNPDGSSLLFTPTDRGNLAQTFREGVNAGQTTMYKYYGESDSKYYRLYSDGEITVAVHKSKPAVIMIFNKIQHAGNCNKVIGK